MPKLEPLPTSPTEINRRLTLLREELRLARFKVSQGQLKNVRTVRQLKRHIARHLGQLNSSNVKPKFHES